MTVPIWLLDVDGVINAIDRGRHSDVWPEWNTGHALAGGASWSITWCPIVTSYIASAHNEGLIEVRWLTTWCEEANGSLRRLLGLPEMPVAATNRAKLAAEHQNWWKLPFAQAAASEGRPLIWTDDDMDDREAQSWLMAERVRRTDGPGLLPIVPRSNVGLTPAHLDEIQAFMIGANT